jgi:hypothetical protein
MTRYKLPEELGGGEVEISKQTPGSTHYCWRILGHSVVLPYEILTEIPPPIPAEPEPGAYLIGEVLCVRWSVEEEPDNHWYLGGSGHRALTWTHVWEAVGGPDVEIIPLVPRASLPEVELPWREPSVYGFAAQVAKRSDGINVSVWGPGTPDRLLLSDATLDRDSARSMAAALLAAAGQES